ncbi:MAG: pyridoxamine 5'-phosphate oxidase family protein [Deltaproteobacteria bacterium]|jgi:nitroimidazol reductase NimA-like FMN-containing flavoprotein (pyridoxamine 5'-phosphate oxidase superfamily)|nr:pyridoxamine 5'-phosphate oxidase family protein [Deltaproteobacteria bacterium]
MQPKMLKHQLTPEQIASLLAQATVGHLATVSPNGQPYVVALNFVVLDGKIYFHGRNQGQKIDYLSAEPRVCFETAVEDGYQHGPTACHSTTKYRSVVAIGTAAVIDDHNLLVRVLEEFTKKYAPQHVEPVFSEESLARTSVIEVTVSGWTGKYFI